MAEKAHPDKTHVLIVGTGFAGLGTAIRLKQAGFDDFVLLEAASEVGGTWRDNHYPGAACDVESHLYSFSFRPKPNWSRMFAPQSEILEYTYECLDAYGLRPYVRLDSRVSCAIFDEDSQRWLVETESGDRYDASVIVSGTGLLSRPSKPEIDGLDSFAGATIHSAQWLDDYDFADKRVGVIGTGASAIQIVPELAPAAAQLSVFQRTPPWILPRRDRNIRGWEQALFRRIPATQQLARKIIYLKRELLALGFVGDKRVLQIAEAVARAFLKRSVPDPELRRQLTPDYTIGCKRVLLSNDYYPTLQRSNVQLVTDPIDRIEARGIVTRSRKLHEFDVLVLATGFNAAEAMAPFVVRGRGGRQLSVAWQGGAEAYLGSTVSGFPNLFMIAGPNTGLGHSSMVFMIESQISYILDCLEQMRQQGIASVDLRPEVQADYNRRLHARLDKSVWASGCKSWYQTPSGKNTTLWPGYTFEFWWRTRRFHLGDYALGFEGQIADQPHFEPGREALST